MICDESNAQPEELYLTFNTGEGPILGVYATAQQAVGNVYSSNNNTATFTLTNSAGCDSIVTLNLTIQTINSTVAQSGNTLTANETNATYQWLDCNNNNTPITNATAQSFPQITQIGNDLTTIGLGEFQWYLNDVAIDGATSNTYTPTADGMYTVSMGFDHCTFTSEPFEIISTSIQTTNYSNIKIRNNPTSDFIFLDNAPANTTWEIYNIEGKRLLTGNNLSDSRIDLSMLESGIYILSCSEKLQKSNFRIIKQSH